ncbi:MAG TPA: hypothetical protein VFC63_03535 [Blastocatellia bacterium]|nr:hypothetical protein [Blastocatellia bacterium]
MPEQRGDKKDKLQGEGDYESGRKYQHDATDFTKTHDVEGIAREAEADLPEEEKRRDQKGRR